MCISWFEKEEISDNKYDNKFGFLTGNELEF